MLGIDPATWPVNAAARILAATETAPQRILVGQRATRPDHPYHALANASPGTRQAKAEADPWTPATWARANPSLDLAPGLREALATEAAAARTNPAGLEAFRRLRLNQGTDAAAAGVLVRAADWRAIETDELPARDGQPYLGVDLGSSATPEILRAVEQDGRRYLSVEFHPEQGIISPSLPTTNLSHFRISGLRRQKCPSGTTNAYEPGKSVGQTSVLRTPPGCGSTPSAS